MVLRLPIRNKGAPASHSRAILNRSKFATTTHPAQFLPPSGLAIDRGHPPVPTLIGLACACARKAGALTPERNARGEPNCRHIRLRLASSFYGNVGIWRRNRWEISHVAFAGLTLRRCAMKRAAAAAYAVLYSVKNSISAHPRVAESTLRERNARNGDKARALLPCLPRCPSADKDEMRPRGADGSHHGTAGNE